MWGLWVRLRTLGGGASGLRVLGKALRSGLDLSDMACTASFVSDLSRFRSCEALAIASRRTCDPKPEAYRA